MSSLFVVKFNGEKEPFSIKKVYRSARRVGASEKLAKKIARIIEKEAYPGIKTSEIFKRVKKLLQQEVPRAALRFNLKKGMKKLGPTGFPFEQYIGAVFSENGFKIKLNKYIPGFCCKKYEIDFLAEKNNFLYIGECKYRHLPRHKVHTDTALANYARFLDIKKKYSFRKDIKLKSLLITNAKFTTRAIKYSECVGVELLGWNYPRNKGLEYLIDSQKLYPITILPSLPRFLAKIFASKKMMLAQDILKIDIKEFARKTKISKKRLEILVKEAKSLLERE